MVICQMQILVFAWKISIFVFVFAGEASMDHKNPDFVPSVFQCMNPNPTTKKKVKRYVSKPFIYLKLHAIYSHLIFKSFVFFDQISVQNRASSVLAQANLS